MPLRHRIALHEPTNLEDVKTIYFPFWDRYSRAVKVEASVDKETGEATFPTRLGSAKFITLKRKEYALTLQEAEEYLHNRQAKKLDEASANAMNLPMKKTNGKRAKTTNS